MVNNLNNIFSQKNLVIVHNQNVNSLVLEHNIVRINNNIEKHRFHLFRYIGKYSLSSILKYALFGVCT